MATIPFLQQATGGGLNRGQGIGLALMGLGQGLQAVSRGQQPNMMPLVAMASQMREENRQQQQAEAWQTYLADVAKTNPAMADQIKAIGALGPTVGGPQLDRVLRKPKPDVRNVGNRLVQVNQDGTTQEIFKAPTTPQIRSAGRQVLSINPETGETTVLATAPAPARQPTAYDRKYAAAINAGASPQEAEAVAAGLLGWTRDVVTGEPVLRDVRSSFAANVPGGGQSPATTPVEAPVPVPGPQGGGGSPFGPASAEAATVGGQGEQGGGLLNIADDAVGAWPTIRRGLAETVGQFFPELVDTDAVAAKTEWDLATNDLIRSMAITDRLGSQEVARITGMLDLDTGLFSSPAAAKTRLGVLDRDFTQTANEYEALSRDSSLPADERRKFATNAAAMRRFVHRLRDPRQPRSSSGAPTIDANRQSELERLYGGQ